MASNLEEEVLRRLEVYSARLRGSVVQALCLHSLFRSLNEAKEHRERIRGSIVGGATNIAQHAVLRELILILVRVFDQPGHRGLERSDKVSFPVVLGWLERPEIEAALRARARGWFIDGYRADKNEGTVVDAIARLRDNLARIGGEQPNRQTRLRDFRDEFLAHELHIEVPRDKPLFGHIGEMCEEIKALSEAASLAIEGSTTAWNFVDGEMSQSADEFWRRVAEGGKGEQ